MKKAMLAMMLLAGSIFAGPRVAVSIGFGVPAPVMMRPACPGPGYVWVNGYYGPHRIWVPGYWRAPAVSFVVGPRFVAPRYYRHDYYRRDYYRRDFDHRREFRDGFVR